MYSIGLIIRFSATLLGLFFAVTGISKIFHFSHFISVVSDYHLLPNRLTSIAALSIVIIELTLFPTLLFNLIWPWPLVVASALILAFAAAMSVNLFRGRQHACGCFGIRNQKSISWRLVMINCCTSMVLLLGCVDSVPVQELDQNALWIPRVLGCFTFVLLLIGWTANTLVRLSERPTRIL